MKPEIGWRYTSGFPGLGDASADFAASAKKLHDIAKVAYQAKSVNDGAAYATAMNQYRRLLAELLPQQRAQVQQALSTEMPSDFLRSLAGLGDTFAGIFKSPILTMALVGAAFLFIMKGATRGMK